MPRKINKNRFPDYERVKPEDMGIVTFGTSLWIRKDNMAIKIIFPTGQEVDFRPVENYNLPKDFDKNKIINIEKYGKK